jgi:catalase
MKGITGSKREKIITRQLNHFYKADEELTAEVALKLNINFKS